MSLKGTKTAEMLRQAFRLEAELNRVLLYFAAKADVEGQNEAGAVFRAAAENGTSQAAGHLEYLEAVSDPVSGLPMGSTEQNLRAASAAESKAAENFYPEAATIARDEGFGEIADWFDALAKAADNQV
ncbi:MAG: ferritin family protein, partial [Gammaproteobacteria bacterium]|nr:ferritin family protein [Gammaproteobacteria bacterium]